MHLTPSRANTDATGYTTITIAFPTLYYITCTSSAIVILLVLVLFIFNHHYLIQEGFLSYKLGSTEVQNIAHSGKFISIPVTCDRRPYNILYGYFYTRRNQKLK